MAESTVPLDTEEVEDTGMSKIELLISPLAPYAPEEYPPEDGLGEAGPVVDIFSTMSSHRVRNEHIRMVLVGRDELDMASKASSSE